MVAVGSGLSTISTNGVGEDGGVEPQATSKKTKNTRKDLLIIKTLQIILAALILLLSF
jgi:hypothetical protein